MVAFSATRKSPLTGYLFWSYQRCFTPNGVPKTGILNMSGSFDGVLPTPLITGEIEITTPPLKGGHFGT